MSRKPETAFRVGKVWPFLKTLTNTCVFAIQQISIRGVPDFLICSRGIFIGLELKDDKGSLSSLQIYNLGQIKKCGGVAMVAYPRNWETCKQVLLELDRGEYNDQNYRWNHYEPELLHGLPKAESNPA